MVGERSAGLLLQAAESGELEVVQAELDGGANVNFQDENGWTALMKGSASGHGEVVQCLLEQGAIIDKRNNKGDTALALAASHGNATVMKKLVESGAEINLANELREVPLMAAALENHADAVRYLLEHGAHVNMQESNGNTALLLASWKGQVEAIRVLLKKNADVNISRPDRKTPLMFAAQSGLVDGMQLLLDHGADIHGTDSNGYTSLMWAAFGGNEEMVSALIALGAKLEARNIKGRTALSVAASNGSLRAADTLIQCGEHVNTTDFYGVTPLMVAALHEKADMVRFLLEQGAAVNLQAHDGDTTLLLAAWRGHTEIVNMLLDHGANTELSKDDGQTPLMWAAQGGFTDIVRLLLAKNANANATNYEGDTALKMAQNNNHSEIVALLSDRTAGPRVHHGFDAVRVASPASNQELHQNRQEPAIAPQSPDDVTMQFTDLLTMCGQMEEACTMCENVLERLQRIQIQANEQPEIVPPNAQADLASIRARFHHFLVKYKQRNPFERLVSTRMVISLLKEFHERLDAVVAEVSEGDNNLSKWMESWDRDTQEVEASLVRLWKTNPMRILDSLPSQKSQEDALVLLGSETTRKKDSYTADSKTMLRSVKQSIIRLSGASVQAVPDWFLAEYEVQREEQHFALGSFGKVYHGTWYREKVVVKCVNAVTEDEMRAFKREARLWFRAQHPNVVRLFGACHVSQPCFFVCEEAKNGNLVDFLNKSKHVDQALTWRLLHGAALGLQFLHGKKIVHGDLKCNQILVTEEKTAKLTDFGFSFALMESKPSTSTGAVRWKAPELLRSESCAPTFESDLYSFGMCVVEAVSGNVPWGSHLPDQSVIYNLNHGIFISRPKAFVSDEQWEFVCELCAFDPLKRLGLCDAIVQLNHFAAEESESN